MSKVVNIVFQREGARLEYIGLEDEKGNVLHIEERWVDLDDDMTALQLRVSDRLLADVEPYVSPYLDPTPLELEVELEPEPEPEPEPQPVVQHDPRMAKL